VSRSPPLVQLLSPSLYAAKVWRPLVFDWKRIRTSLLLRISARYVINGRGYSQAKSSFVALVGSVGLLGDSGDVAAGFVSGGKVLVNLR